MVYKWRPGYRYSVPAQVAGEVCEELSSKGMLTASHLVEVSAPEDAPLHPCFEWDDTKAARLYREEEARSLIKSVYVEEVKDETPRRQFYNIKVTGATYEPIDVIMRTPDKRELLMEQAKNDMKSFRAKYMELNELSKVFDAMAEVMEERA